MSGDPGPIVALLSVPVVAVLAIASHWKRIVGSGWASIVAARFDLSGFTPSVLSTEWLPARIGLKHFEAIDALVYFHVRAQATSAGLVVTSAQRGRRAAAWFGWRPLYIPWEQVAIVDPDDPHHRGSDLCLHVGGRAEVLVSMEGWLAEATRAALAARQPRMPDPLPYR